jgi:hypothetical protein
MTPHPLRWLYALLPWLLGLAAFLLVAGPRVLDPGNVAWLGSDDPASHYLGWVFFRQAAWSFPIGSNPDFGLELSSSIVYSDSIPLFAFLFKAVGPLLPDTFQYTGLWLLLCFLLQAWLAWKLTGLVTASVVLRSLACILFLFAPPMLWRLAGHWALAAHFLLLATLYLVLCPALDWPRRYAWALLVAVVALVHAYLLAMVGLCWLADLGDRLRRRELHIDAAAKEALTVIVLLLLVCWQAGYFGIEGGLAHGSFYGYFRANLLTLLDSSGWSYLLRDLPEGRGDYEGFNYLGLGVIVLGLTALPLLAQQVTAGRQLLQRHLLLSWALLLLAGFAITHKPAFGWWSITLPMPDLLLHLAEIFRSSGRMLWPLFYVLLLMLIATVIKSVGHRTAVCLLTLAVVLQLLDTHAGWRTRRESLMVPRAATMVPAPQDQFWEQAAARYAKVRVLPPGNKGPLWKQVASFAGTHGLATDAVYLARIDNAGYATASALADEVLATGRYADDTLYILDENLRQQAELSLDPERDMMTTVDGVLVVAPGWVE